MEEKEGDEEEEEEEEQDCDTFYYRNACFLRIE